MNRIITTCCLCLAWFSNVSSAQDTVTRNLRQTSATLVPDNATVAQLDGEIEAARVEWQVPGLAVAIVKDDQILLSKGYGMKRVDTSEAVDADTLFAIASNSKAFTAAALAMLVDEGKVSWDDPVSKYLPYFRLKDPLASGDIRVRDLLCHRSGLGTFSGDLLWWGTPYTPKEILQRAAQLEPAAPFRADYGYSNLMFLAAGEVIEAASGQKWSDFISERILKPLEMDRTITSVRDLVAQENYATPHKTLRDSSKPIAWMNWDSMAAAGGVISSSDDMSAWLRAQLRGGELANGKRLFSDKGAHEMFQAQIAMKLPAKPSARFPSTHFRAYGLGWALSDYKGNKVVGHGGGYDGMYSQVLLVPEQKLGVVVLTNSMTSISSLLAYRAVDLFLGGESKNWSSESLKQFRKSREEFDNNISKAITAVAKNTTPSHPPQDYAGKFRCPMYGDAEVVVENDKLVLKLLPYPDLVGDLEHLHYDTFVIRWRKEFAWFGAGTAHFVANAKGEFTDIALDVPNEDLWFYEIKLKRIENAKGQP